MPNKILSIKDYEIKSSDIFFLDNNIWMFLHCPIGDYQEKKQRQYSRFIENVISRNNPIFINSLILSEFANSYLRLRFDQLRKTRPELNLKKYKADYVGSIDFRNTIIQVKSAINNILKMSEKGNDDFNSLNISELLQTFSTIDFNDSYYISLAKRKNWIIITDDSDFTKENNIPDLGITVITYLKN